MISEVFINRNLIILIRIRNILAGTKKIKQLKAQIIILIKLDIIMIRNMVHNLGILRVNNYLWKTDKMNLFLVLIPLILVALINKILHSLLLISLLKLVLKIPHNK
jgi:hypothetical protein